MHVLDSGHAEAVLDLAADDIWAPHRYLRIFGTDVGGAAQQAAVSRAIKARGMHLVAVDADQTVGYIGVERNDDLSEHFEIPIFEIGPVLTHPDGDRRVIAGPLVEAAVEQVDLQRSSDRSLVMMRIGADDVDLQSSSQVVGFAVRDILLTFINDLARAHRNPVVPESYPHISIVELDGRTDWLTADDMDRLRIGAGYFIHDHYHRDPLLDDERCQKLYLRQLERSIAGEGADVAVVHRQEEAILGVGFWRKNQDLAALGVLLADGSFGLRLSGGPPGVVSDEFSSYVCNRPVVDNRLLEWSTQVTNFSQVNMATRERSIRLCRSSMALHLWRGGMVV